MFFGDYVGGVGSDVMLGVIFERVVLDLILIRDKDCY